MKIGSIHKTLVKPAYGEPRMRSIEVIGKTRFGTPFGKVLGFGYTLRYQDGKWVA